MAMGLRRALEKRLLGGNCRCSGCATKRFENLTKEASGALAYPSPLITTGHPGGMMGRQAGEGGSMKVKFVKGIQRGEDRHGQ